MAAPVDVLRWDAADPNVSLATFQQCHIDAFGDAKEGCAAASRYLRVKNTTTVVQLMQLRHRGTTGKDWKVIKSARPRLCISDGQCGGPCGKSVKYTWEMCSTFPHAVCSTFHFWKRCVCAQP
jgi:hypothetical protein